MRKFIIAIIFIMSLLPLSVVSAQSEYGEEYDEMLRSSGAQELYDKLPESTQEYLSDSGIFTVDADSLKDMKVSTVLNVLWQGVIKQVKLPLRLGLMAIGVVLLAAMINGLEDTVNKSPQKNIFSVVTVLCLSAIIMTPIIKVINDTVSLVKQAGDFLLSFIPVYTGIVAVSGKPLSAFAYYSVIMGVMEFMTVLATGFLIPLIGVYLSLCITGATTDAVNISSLAKSIKKLMIWALGFIMSVFVGVLTIKSFVANSADNVTVKTGKFLISSFVPIVGNSLSDALSVINGSMGVIKSAVGGFGILAVLMTFLPSVISIGLIKLALQTAHAASEALGVNKVSQLLESTSFVMSLLMTFLICFGVMIIISVSLMLVLGLNV